MLTATIREVMAVVHQEEETQDVNTEETKPLKKEEVVLLEVHQDNNKHFLSCQNK